VRAAAIACDLCELRTDVCWVIRTDHFTVLIGDEPHFYPDGDEWGLCSLCKRDVLADDQFPILARRREAIIRDSQPGWDGLPPDDKAAVVQVVSLIVMTVLSCRQKTWGRAWTSEDERNAQGQLRLDGARGIRR